MTTDAAISIESAQNVAGQLHDIQALLRTGFVSHRASCYWLLRVVDVSKARAWLQRLLASGLVTSAAQVGARAAQALPAPSEAVALAFSYRGLLAFGAQEHSHFPFPSAFVSGLGSETRRRLLRDDSREQWRWSDSPQPSRFEAHLLLAHYWDIATSSNDSDAGAALAKLLPSAQPLPSMQSTPLQTLLPPPDAADSGFEVRRIDGCPSYLQGDSVTEPFGFADGIGQPLVEGLHQGRIARAQNVSGDAPLHDRLVAPGEFVLGHRNQYGELAYCPDLIGWQAQPRVAPFGSRFGLNGSYLAVRQIEQNVAAFRRLYDVPAAPDIGCPFHDLTLAEKLLGRRKDGQPLAWLPQQPSDPDAFRYRVNDPYGFQCPRGAHVRRANPRDTLGHDVDSGIESSKLHRLLRRGRPYRQENPACQQAGSKSCGEAAHQDNCGAGIMFIACNADLDRQYEFVQQRWLGNLKFADLHDEDDPIVGVASNAFSTQGLPLGERHSNLEQFTQTVGGGYFFAPSITALHFLSKLH